METIKCPFCGEDDFDLIGLKSHLINHCETFRDTEDADITIKRQILQLRKARAAKGEAK